MSDRFEIKAKYSTTTLTFSKLGRQHIDYPIVDVVLKDYVSGRQDTSVKSFLIDTGASISIINKSCDDFIKKFNLKPIDTVSIVYGAGISAPCDVYKIVMTIDSIDVEVKVAYDTRCHFLVLGHFDFFEKMTHNIFNSKSKHSILIKEKTY